VVSRSAYHARTAPARDGAVPAQPVQRREHAWVAQIEEFSEAKLATCSERERDCRHSKCCVEEAMRCCQMSNESFPSCRASCGGDDDEEKAAAPAGGPAGSGATSCSKPGADCRHSKCCQGDDLQCYAKNDYWASCSRTCNDRVLDPSDWTTWSCKALGPRTPHMCSTAGHDCSKSKCCSDTGHQCFQKNASYAACKKTCSTGVLDHTSLNEEKWSCRKLRPSMQGAAPPPSSYSWGCSHEGQNCRWSKCCKTPQMSCYEKDKWWASCHYACDTTYADATDNKTWTCVNLEESQNKCSWSGEDCGLTKCCNSPFDSCYEMTKHFAGCRRTCEPGTDAAKGWNCTKLGGSVSDRGMLRAVYEYQAAGTSLFCFTIVTPHTHEPSLVQAQHKSGIGIFQCDGYLVFSGRKFPRSVGADLETFYEIDAFHRVWDDVLVDGRYRIFEWTVKLDPDTVFFPERLRHHLARLRPPANTSMYIKGSPGAGPRWEVGFAGPVQVFSEKALELYSLKKDLCFENLGHLTQEGLRGGDHVYMRACMDAIGAGFMADPDLLVDRSDPALCGNTSVVAFHAHKTLESWLGCYNEAPQTGYR